MNEYQLQWFYKGECIRAENITAESKHLAYDKAIEGIKPENWDRFHIEQVTESKASEE